MFEDVIGAILAGNGIGVALWVWLNAKFKELEAPLAKVKELDELVTKIDKDFAVLRRDVESMANGKKPTTGGVPVLVMGTPTPIEGVPRL